MSRNYEALSAFLDGETTEFETRRVLRDLDRDDLETLGRWQSVSDVLHGHAAMAAPTDFNARLSEALAAEAKPGRRAGVVHGFARVAVAASVAAVTVIGWQYWSGAADTGNAVPAVAMTGAANDGVATQASLSAPAATQRMTRPFGETSLVAQSALRSAEPRTVASDQQPRVNAMLLRHSEFTARHSGQGMMPYARLVSMDARNGAR
ncbi:sigma-E factor negative regulatory protein [Alloalcanivorax gelatiniphagus]|uniref:RNA polymerase subunit sigma n=1 Tax=Alloalcanivorax gelatiniphagus TaxID=1194167 RepID=A0ABY2XLW2_9GAMM|nr:sigma-E factor negative regulatory protein [Alloalcanivorax gelatiniphagus]TMW12737.1 RNA polymerase subunit sigma [Alloalcanivorax gelatiniphagus]|tara:strand:+ start:1543 stop:2163 length:621 start_codon:yes stop_codon:yes gene_type:complete